MPRTLRCPYGCPRMGCGGYQCDRGDDIIRAHELAIWEDEDRRYREIERRERQQREEARRAADRARNEQQNRLIARETEQDRLIRDRAAIFGHPLTHARDAGEGDSTTMPQTIRTPWARCFGVEIETAYGEWSSSNALAEDLARALTRISGRRVATDGEDGGNVMLSNGWGVCSDGSCGWEVKSPILSGDAGIASVAMMMQAMDAAGCEVNSSCGIHIHVDTRDIREDATKIGNLAAMVTRAEDIIFGVVNRSRNGNNFCRPFNPEQLSGMRAADSFERAMLHWYGYLSGRNATANTSDFLRYVYNDRTQHYHSTRYNGANFHSMFYRGSIEFRYFNSTVTRPDLVGAWIVFCTALVEYAARANRVKIAKRAHVRYGDEKLPKRFARLLRAFASGRVLGDFPVEAADVLARRMSRRISQNVCNPLVPQVTLNLSGNLSPAAAETN